MLYRRKLYILLLILLIAFGFVMYTFIAQKEMSVYRGTLVNRCSQEAVV
jgi:uncharacterized protein YneF (UPF0154 family)